MAQYDGSIRINTKIDTKGASSQLMTLENRIVKTADKIAALRSKMDALKETKAPTEEYAALDKELGKLAAQYDKIAERQQRFLATGGKEGSSAYKRMEYDLDSLDKKQDAVIAKMKNLEFSGKAFTYGNPEEISKTEQQLKYAQNDMEVLLQKQEVLKAKTGDVSSSYTNLAESVKNSFHIMEKGLKDIPTTLAKKGVEGLKTAFKGLGNIAQKSVSVITSGLKKMTSSMFNFGKSAKSSNSMLQSGFKNILKYGLGIRSVYALVNKLRTAIKEGFSNMANEVEGFKVKVDSLKASALTLKNSFAAAFRPLVETAIPYIQMAVDAMSELIDKAGQFMAAVSGQKTYTKAIKQTTKAIEDENKAQNKQLSGLDKLNNLTSGSSGGADSGASSQMFEENVPISSKFENMAQQFKDMWANADFSDLGSAIGKNLKNALEKIPWNPIKKAASKVGKSFATLINGIVEVPGLALSIGKTIGEAINTGIDGINSFLDNTNWDSVGKFIGDSLNGIVNSIDWRNIGHLFAAKFNAIFATIGEAARTFDWANFGLELSNGVNQFIEDFDWAENGARLGDLVKGALDTVITFLENVNWQELGNNVATFIGSIDWTGLFDRLSEGIGAAIGGLAAFLWGLIEEAWNSVVEWWNEAAYEGGKFSIEGLFLGILEVLANVGFWIREHIFEPIIKGFCEAFGIHSPSTVMAEQGNFIMQGLFNGISAMVEKVVGLVVGIKDKIVGAFNFISSKTFVIWNGIIDTIKGVIEWITSKINGLLSLFEKVTDSAKAVSVASGKMGSTIGGIIGGSMGGRNAFSGASSYATNPALLSVSNASIPALARGTVVPPNREFLAMLGDNKTETEIVSPLSTMKQANRETLLEVLSELGLTGGGDNGDIVINIDGREVFRAVRKQATEFRKQTGKPAFSQ